MLESRLDLCSLVIQGTHPGFSCQQIQVVASFSSLPFLLFLLGASSRA